MDPFWLAVAELWWVAPAAVGAGATALVGLRFRRSARHRRLGVESAQLELRTAKADALTARHLTRTARAEVARLQAERAGSFAIGRARTQLREAERHARAASASVRSSRSRVRSARAALAGPVTPENEPLPQLYAQHNAVMAQWMRYETDPALRIAYPAMSDVSHPAVIAYLSALDTARDARPDASQKRVTPAEFSAYRRAVAALDAAFAELEHTVVGPSGDTNSRSRPMPRLTGISAAWQDTAHDMVNRAADGVDRVTGLASAALEAWTRRKSDTESSERPPREDTDDQDRHTR